MGIERIAVFAKYEKEFREKIADWQDRKYIRIREQRDVLGRTFTSIKFIDGWERCDDLILLCDLLEVSQPQLFTPKPKIYYFTPFDSEKNIGRSHNQHCEIVPNSEDWICIIDSDVLFLLPDTKKQIEDVIRKHGNDYQVFGCLTNRIASPHQRHRKEVDECTDILVHKVIAERYQIWHYDEVIETTINVAGFLMIFQKKTWEKYGFSDNSLRFDSEFTDKIKADGGRLGIMQGVYVFHDYRLGHDNPTFYIDHLK